MLEHRLRASRFTTLTQRLRFALYRYGFKQRVAGVQPRGIGSQQQLLKVVEVPLLVDLLQQEVGGANKVTDLLTDLLHGNVQGLLLKWCVLVQGILLARKVNR